MKHRITIPSPVTNDMTFAEEMFLAGHGDKWTFRPIRRRPLVTVGDIGASHVPSYEPPQVEFPQTRPLPEYGYATHGASCQCAQCLCLPDPPRRVSWERVSIVGGLVGLWAFVLWRVILWRIWQ